MTALPIDLKSSRMIFIGAFLGLAEEAIVMAACSENGGIWLENNHRDKFQMEEDALGAIDGMQNITYWARGTESDQIAALHAFLAWLQRMPKRYQEDENIREINWRRLTGRKEDKNFYYMEQERKWCQKMGLNLIRLHEVSFPRTQDLGPDSGVQNFSNGPYYGLHRSSVVTVEP